MKQDEYGRSMVEILGVLAIIGILSIGGIIGYRYAMTKYHSNELMNELNRRIVLMKAKAMTRTINPGFVDEDGEFSRIFADKPYYITTYYHGNSMWCTYVDNVAINICKQILKDYAAPYKKYATNSQGTNLDYTGNNTNICDEIQGALGLPNMAFCYNDSNP